MTGHMAKNSINQSTATVLDQNVLSDSQLLLSYSYSKQRYVHRQIRRKNGALPLQVVILMPSTTAKLNQQLSCQLKRR